MEIAIYKQMKYAEINHFYDKELNDTTVYDVGGQDIEFKNGLDLTHKLTCLKEYGEVNNLENVTLRDIQHNQFIVTFEEFLTLRYSMIERGVLLQAKKSSLYDEIKNAITEEEILLIKWNKEN